MTKLLVGLLLLAGCDLSKLQKAPTAPGPVVPEERQRRLDQIADINSKIDLAVAEDDWRSIDFQQGIDKRKNEALQRAYSSNTDSKGEVAEIRVLQQQAEKADADLDKALDRAARHRCGR
jgi:hypothetical protein